MEKGTLARSHTLPLPQGSFFVAVRLPDGAQYASACPSQLTYAWWLLAACILYLQTLAVLQQVTVSNIGRSLPEAGK